ncbi:hypothetical protein [Teredinibacter sp. KSP-S5-2]|uniref:hypothetical protein n=1 Tax=Teredinibacter sp. KSP-S5-2 TaxID=3034506 RepID=UPI0029349A8E|nr:hypothetical protein [Teredinibacter sp. KSP-S5-2]WNO07975.1 hypothetical protein P5V12_13405 [Teredinibacter sp. KSP-S5-2]
MFFRLFVLLLVAMPNMAFSSVTCEGQHGDSGFCNVSYIKKMIRNAEYIKEAVSGKDIKLLKNTYAIDYAHFSVMINEFNVKAREIIHFHGARSDYGNIKYKELESAVSKYSYLSFEVMKLLAVNNINFINFGVASLSECEEYDKIRSYWMSVAKNYKNITSEYVMSVKDSGEVISQEKWTDYLKIDPVIVTDDKERYCLAMVLSIGPVVETLDSLTKQ